MNVEGIPCSLDITHHFKLVKPEKERKSGALSDGEVYMHFWGHPVYVVLDLGARESEFESRLMTMHLWERYCSAQSLGACSITSFVMRPQGWTCEEHLDSNTYGTLWHKDCIVGMLYMKVIAPGRGATALTDHPYPVKTLDTGRGRQESHPG